MVLEALAYSKRMRGQGQDAVTGYRKILAEEPDNKEAQVGLLLAYSISERNLPGPGAELLTKAIRELRPFPDDLVKFYLEQTLKPTKRGSTPVNLPAPSGLIRSLPGSDTLRPQIQMTLTEMATRAGACQPRAALCLAEMSVGEGKAKAAIPHLKTAITTDPRLDEAYALALDTFKATDQLPALHHLLVNVLSQDAKNVLAQKAMNQLYERYPEIAGKVGPNPLKEPKESEVSSTIRTSATAPTLEPDGVIDSNISPDDRFAMAVDALKQGKAQVARELFEDLSQKKFPRMDTLRALLAMACLKLKDNDGARLQVDRIQWGKLPAQEIYPLARMLETSGQLEPARAVYKRLLEEFPDYKDVKDRLKLIEREMGS
jgi:tetratricopeptide (TPR) repeat protein